MIDETFHTDRDVGEFIEGLRNAPSNRKRGGRTRRRPDHRQMDKNAALLDMIKDMEAQIAALSGESAPSDVYETNSSYSGDARRSGLRRSRSSYDDQDSSRSGSPPVRQGRSARGLSQRT